MRWFTALECVQGLSASEIMIAMSDGSRSDDGFGGCGYFGILMSSLSGMTIEELRRRIGVARITSEYDCGAVAVARRCSIEFCELEGVFEMAKAVLNFAMAIRSTRLRVVSMSIDSLSVLKWIGGEITSYDELVRRNIANTKYDSTMLEC